MQPWNLKEQFLKEVERKGGFVNCHAHFDKAFYITKEKLHQASVAMEKKWTMSDDIKRNSTEEDIAVRIRTALDIFVAQGSKLTASFVDAYEAVGHKAMNAAKKVKEEYKDKIELLILTQPLGGLVDKEARDLFEAISANADIVGGLPSKDRPKDDLNFDYLFGIAKNLNKPLHVHIDQDNLPEERDTERLVSYTKKHGYEGRVVAIHAVSTAGQPKEYRKQLYRSMADAGIAAVVCPSAMLSQRQRDEFMAPIHNSIANVPEMIEAGVLVGLGVDNIADFYLPYVDGDMWTEVRMLQETCRYHDFDQLVNIASVNGKKLLSIK